MYASEKSDIGVLPKKEPNNAEITQQQRRHRREGRRPRGILERPTVTCTQRQEKALNGLDRIRKAAKKDKSFRFTSLMHHITVDLLRDSFKSLKHDAAPGVDDVTWQQYSEQQEERIPGLHERVQSGRYRAMPSKRIWIPKPDGRQRPIGIAVVEDKIVQHAVVTVLNQIYEETFLGFSYGFRPKRHQHKALDAIWVGITQRKVNWVLDQYCSVHNLLEVGKGYQ